MSIEPLSYISNCLGLTSREHELLEHHRREPTPEETVKLSVLFGVSPDALCVHDQRAILDVLRVKERILGRKSNKC